METYVYSLLIKIKQMKERTNKQNEGTTERNDMK